MSKRILFSIFLCAFAQMLTAQNRPSIEYKNHGLSWFPIHFYKIDGKITNYKTAGKVLKVSPDAYRQFRKGRNLSIGSTTLIFGSTVASLVYDYKIDKNENNFDTNDKLVMGGQLLTLASVITMDVYSVKLHKKAVKTFDGDKNTSRYEKKEEPLLKIGTIGTAVGLQLDF